MMAQGGQAEWALTYLAVDTHWQDSMCDTFSSRHPLARQYV